MSRISQEGAIALSHVTAELTCPSRCCDAAVAAVLFRQRTDLRSVPELEARSLQQPTRGSWGRCPYLGDGGRLEGG